MARTKLSQIITGLLPYQNITHDDAIVLVGRSDRGPSMIPVYADNKKRVIELYGPDSELTIGYLEASAMGGKNIYLIRINGNHASSTWTSTIAEDDYLPLMEIISVDATDEANNLFYNTVDIEGTKLFQIYNYDRTDDSTNLIYEYVLNGLTLGELESRINSDAYVLRRPIYALAIQSKNLLIESVFSEERDMLKYGSSTSSLTPSFLQNNIEVILNNLFGTNVRQIGFLYSAFTSTAPGNNPLYNLYSDFTLKREEAGNPCFINISVDCAEREDIKEIFIPFLTEAYPQFNEVGLLLKDPSIRLSEYVNVIVAKFSTNVIYTDKENPIFTSGVAAYCGLIDSLKYGETTTNKPIKVAMENRLYLEDTTINLLMDLGFTVFSNNQMFEKDKGYKVLSGVNFLEGSKGISYSATYGEEILGDEYEELILIDENYPPTGSNGYLEYYKSNNITKVPQSDMDGEEIPPRFYYNRDVRSKYRKPSLLGRFGNALFVCDFTRRLHARIEEYELDRITEKDLILIIEDVIEEFKRVIRYSEYTVDLKYRNGYKEFIVNINLILYGEVQNINISVTA